jgi:hypothetical protein
MLPRVKTQKNMKTIIFFASLGVVAGYGHKNEAIASPEKIAGEAWQKAAEKIFTATGTYIGAVISPAVTVYHTEWGCPVGGEKTVNITGECNPAYTKLETYKKAVVETLRETALSLEQSTTQLTFVEAEFEYLDFRKNSRE